MLFVTGRKADPVCDVHVNAHFVRGTYLGTSPNVSWYVAISIASFLSRLTMSRLEVPSRNHYL